MILLALTVPISLIGIIYPFKPFHKRRNALFTLLGSFVLLAILIPDPQSDTSTTSTIKAASTTETRLGTVETPEDQSVGDEVVDRQQAALAAHQRKLDTIRKSIDSHNWSYARDLYLLVVRENYQLEEFIVEIEARVLELVRPIPASDHQANLDGYRLLATLRPENATYSTKVTEYQARISQARQSAITRLRQKVDRVEGITWFQHPNQPKYLNSRSTVYLYIGRRGETGRPTLRMRFNIQVRIGFLLRRSLLGTTALRSFLSTASSSATVTLRFGNGSTSYRQIIKSKFYDLLQIPKKPFCVSKECNIEKTLLYHLATSAQFERFCWLMM